MAFENMSALHATAFLSGVLLHVTVFRFGEWDMHALGIIAGGLLLDFCAAGVLRYRIAAGPASFWQALQQTSSALGICIAGIFSSILVYRLAFHRLNRFPGPFWARISNVYPTTLSFRGSKFQLYKEVQALHRQYGDIVRLALHTYEPRVAEQTAHLVECIDERQGQAMDVNKWFSLYSFEVMTHVGFGQAFGALREGEAPPLLSASKDFMLYLRVFGHLVWLYPLYTLLLGNLQIRRFFKMISQLVRQRRERQCVDLFSWILSDYETLEKPTLRQTIDLYGDALTVIVAGSQTVSQALTCLFFELAQHPRVLALLQDEVDECYATAGGGGEEAGPGAQPLSKLEYLQACINETLRLWSAVPSGLPRKTPPQGLDIGGVFIPGDVVVQNPQYTMFRDERLFPRPDEFVPERWTTQPDLVADITRETSAFVPFSYGRFACAGKGLALQELTVVTSRIVRRYDVRLAPGSSSAEFTRGVKDFFTLEAPSLHLCFDARKR
ncbi:hypothetical protein JDV02_000485 [Purpureocillium takamizusanense]|uniref:Cytochrome P450 n=1 Tax=Purpureocillium takamizusanense TaxID=2060973 RepID=A0A9Q8V5J1_9HYPO|nr:uncharacterized protein JDV02_000485 [Purpureocillium takamizusanense]UNI13775.1 hypothetical protein JDV02_000485 [Purpureocillium takamizusanense]